MKRIIVIMITLITSFLLASYAINNIFLAETPRINPYYLSNLGMGVKSTVNKIAQLFNFKKSLTNTIANYNNPAEMPNSLFKAVSKGVSAYEKSPDETYLRIDKGTQYKIKQITLKDGTILKAIDFTGQ